MCCHKIIGMMYSAMKRHGDDNEDKQPDKRPRLHQVTSHTTCLHTRITYDSNTTSLINRPRRLHLAWWRCPSHWFICCRAIPSLLGVSHTARRLCVCLHNLNMSSCRELTDVRFISLLVRLRILDLRVCNEQLVDVSPLSSLTSLTALYLSCSEDGGQRQLVDVSFVSFLTSLASLNMPYRIEELDLVGCEKLIDVSPLSSLTSLASLYMPYCSQLSEVSPLSSLTSLTSLNLAECDQLSDVSPLWSLTSLTSLDLSWCNQLNDVSPLSSLTSLITLNLWGCDQLSDASPLSSLAACTV